MSTPTVRAVTAVQTTATVTLPTGWQPGDIVVIDAFYLEPNSGPAASINNINAPAGWTPALGDSTLGTVSGTNGYNWHRVFYRKMQAGDTNPTLTKDRSSSGSSWAIRALAIVGADIVDAGTMQGSNPTTTAVALPRVTPDNDSTLLVAALHWGSASTTYTAPAGWSDNNISNWGTLMTKAGPAAHTQSPADSITFPAPPYVVWGTLLAFSPILAPYGPNLEEPSGDYLDATDPIEFRAQYVSADTAGANEYCLRIKQSTAGSYSYWNASTGALQGTAVWNTLAVAQDADIVVTLPASVLANGHDYQWSMAAQELRSNLQGPFAADATFTTRVAPAVAVTGPTGPVGTSRPVVAWTPTPAAGASQTAYEVQVETDTLSALPGSGTVAWSSGVVASAAGTATVGTDLENFTLYRAYVRVTQTGGQVSDWAYIDFTLDLDAPATPSLVVTQDTDPATGMPRAKLLVTGADTGGGTFDHTNTTFLVEYSDDGGTTWASVAGATAIVPSSSDVGAAAYDYGAPFGGARKYRAKTIGIEGDNLVPSEVSPVKTLTLTSKSSWLSDPTDPSSAMRVWVSGTDTRQWPVDTAVHQPLGEPGVAVTDAIVVFGAVRSVTDAFTFLTQTKAEREQLLAMLRSCRPLLLRRRPDSDTESGEARYYAFTNPTEDRLVKARSPYRGIKVTAVEVAAP